MLLEKPVGQHPLKGKNRGNKGEVIDMIKSKGESHENGKVIIERSLPFSYSEIGENVKEKDVLLFFTYLIRRFEIINIKIRCITRASYNRNIRSWS